MNERSFDLSGSRSDVNEVERARWKTQRTNDRYFLTGGRDLATGKSAAQVAKLAELSEDLRMATSIVDTSLPVEEVIEPDLPIIDPHHHLWPRSSVVLAGKKNTDELTPFERVSLSAPRYLLDELLADFGGHNVRATVFVQCHTMYRADGPSWLAPVGETEFATGIAAMSASGVFGPARVNAGIVGSADLRLGDKVQGVLEAHVAAGGGRFRGIRQSAAWDADPSILGHVARTGRGLLLDQEFRNGFAKLAPLGLSFDAWLLEPQLPDLIDLARAFPGTSIILDHVGAPLGIGPYAGKREELFPRWRNNIRALADLPNVAVKLGGLGIVCPGFDSFLATRRRSSMELAEQWRPYIDTCIEYFGPARAMFESNFPTDRGTASYNIIWNTFKRMTQSMSVADRAALFHDTAQEIYRLKPEAI